MTQYSIAAYQDFLDLGKDTMAMQGRAKANHD